MKKTKNIKIPAGDWFIISSRDMDFLKVSLANGAPVKPLKRVLGGSYSIRVGVGSRNFVSFYVLAQDIKDMGQIIKKRFLDNPAAFKKFLAKYYQAVRDLLKVVRQIAKTDYKILSNKELTALLEKYFKAYIAPFPYGMIGNQVATSGIAPVIKKFLSAKKYPGSFDEALNRLILPDKETFVFQEEQNLLNLASYINKRSLLKKKVLKLLKKSPSPSLNDLLTIDVNLGKKLRGHLDEFRWLLLAMFRGRWQSRLIKRLKDLLQLTPAKLDLRLKEHKGGWQRLRSDQQGLLKKLKPPAQIRRAIELLSAFVGLRDHFGPINRYTPEEVKPLFREVAKRLKLTFQEVVHLTNEEMLESLTKNKSFRREAKARQKYFVIIDNFEGQYILTGLKAKEFFQQNVKGEKIGWKKEELLTGQIASAGKARGVARVVLRVSDLRNVKKGDVLVSPNTTTEMMRAIRKVSAIVTDEGGLGSHAAIVSREFSIPCIVGSRVGTKVIKNGDLIEVDADKGIINNLNINIKNLCPTK